MKKIAILLASAMMPMLAAMGADIKFQKKAAEKVWSIRPGLFNPQREVPDSLRDHFSAVVIGQYDYVDADYNSHDGVSGPDATPEQLMDMAWTAANYVNVTDKEGDASDFWIALMMCDILRKEKLFDNAAVAFVNPYNDVPTEEITNWRQPDFGMIAGERMYIFSEQSTFLPSELHPRYQGQLVASYPGERDKLWDFNMPTVVTLPTSKASVNKVSHSCTITLGDDNEVNTEDEVTLAGGMKYLASPLTNFSEWIATQEDYLGIEPNKRYKTKTKDDGKREEELKEATADIYRNFYTGEEAELSGIEILTRGITPEAPEFRFKFSAKAPEAYSVAGDEIILKIGSFSGRQDVVESTERSRNANITMMAASQDNSNVTVNLPEGYDVDEATLAALSNNVQNPVGMFVSSTKKSADGRSVTVATRTRYNHPVLNANAWEDMLKIIDAKSAFNDTLLVLKKMTCDRGWRCSGAPPYSAHKQRLCADY